MQNVVKDRRVLLPSRGCLDGAIAAMSSLRVPTMWIVSQPRAFIVTFLCGLIVGFFLGVHAVTGSNPAGASMICVGVFGAIVGAVSARRGCPRPDRWFGCSASRECDPPRRRALLPPSQLSGAEDAEAALHNLGFSVRDARIAVAGAVSSLGDDADAAVIVKAALRSGRV